MIAEQTNICTATHMKEPDMEETVYQAASKETQTLLKVCAFQSLPLHLFSQCYKARDTISCLNEHTVPSL